MEIVEETGLGRTILPEFQHFDRELIQSHLAALPRRDFPSCLASALIGSGLNAEPLAAIGQRWKLSNEEQRQTGAAIKYWALYTETDSLPWSRVQPYLIDRDAEVILNVATAVAMAGPRR